MKIEKIKRLSISEIKSLHKNYMRSDFPANELRPFGMIKGLVRRGRYFVYGAYSGGRLAGYFSLFAAESGIILLDYLAVKSGMRGRGVGSSLFGEIIKTVKRDYPAAKAVAIECESPKKAKNQEERTVREKRIRFYQKNGAVVTACSWCAFGVDYTLLAVPLNKSDVSTLPLGQEVYSLYLSTFPHPLRIFAKKFLRYS